MELVKARCGCAPATIRCHKGRQPGLTQCINCGGVMSDWIVVAFYTRETMYEKEVEKLLASLARFGVDIDTLSYANTGDWINNTRLKPHFIKEMMHRHPGKKIVYLDSDAEMCQYPIVFDNFTADIGYARKGTEILSGTLIFANNERTHVFMDQWIEQEALMPTISDQPCFHRALRHTDCTVEELPREYCFIFDDPNRCSPVIQQNQASRRFKNHLTEELKMSIPGIRRLIDGKYTLVRPTPDLVARMNAEFQNVGTNRWLDKSIKSVTSQFQAKFPGETAYIVGKGPSLDRLTAQHFDTTGPVFCINEAIHAVEKLDIKNPVFGVQQDVGLKNTCAPARGIIFVSHSVQAWYANFDRKIVYVPHELGLKDYSLTAQIAVELCKRFAVAKIVMLCFDSFQGNTEYAKAVGYAPTRGGNPTRFLQHAKMLQQQLGKFPYEVRKVE